MPEQAPARTSARSRLRAALSWLRAALAWRHGPDVLAAAVFALMAASLLTIAVQGRPLSVVDEPTHYDNAIRVERGEYPHRGSVYTMAMVDEWACGVGHETGRLPVPCGDPELRQDYLPMTRWTTGYIHYPTYFVEVAAGSRALAVVDDSMTRIDRMRVVSTLLLLAGVAVSWLLARSNGLSGSRRLAVTFAPVAAPGILFYGPMVNPGAAATLCGALVAWTGLRWLRRGTGFWWYAAASLYASVTAATSSLAVGVVALATGIAWLAGFGGRRLLGELQVRWWQLLVQALVFLGPVVAWGQVIEAQATVPNEVVYAVVAVTSTTRLIAGSVQELTTLHSPWQDVVNLAADKGLVEQLLRAPGYGLPVLVTVLVFGLLLQTALGERSGPTAPGHRLLVVSLLLVVFLFPPALRLSNAMNFGVDFGIVARYLISLAPFAVLLAVQGLRGTGVPRFLAAISLVTIVGACVTAW